MKAAFVLFWHTIGKYSSQALGIKLLRWSSKWKDEDSRVLSELCLDQLGVAAISTLRKCPFCGANAYVCGGFDGMWSAHCMGRDQPFPCPVEAINYQFYSEEEAILSWNSRITK